MRNTLQDDISRMLANIYDGDAGENTQTPGTGPANEYDVYVEPDRITFIKRQAPEGEASDFATPVTIVPVAEKTSDESPLLNPRASTQLAYATILFSLFLILFSLMMQLQIALNPPTAIITIIPKSQTLTLSGTVQMGRVLAPITLSQQQAVRTTGHGHQDAKLAKGFITFYNGQLTPQFIPSGTILTGTDDIQIATGQDATIPALDPTATPPTLGQVTISAHAVNAGASGNIQAYDINQPFHLVIAKNTAAFTGGQDERNFQIVTKKDISTASATLKTILTQSMPGALQGQLKNGESLLMLPCGPTTASDHQIGEEAAQVTVTVSFTCLGVAYNKNTLRAKVTQLLTAQAIKKLGTGYTLAGDFLVSVKRAIPTPRVFLSFSSSGTWVYALTQPAQEHIKALVAGKNKTTALQFVSALPGIERVSIAEVDDSTPLPKDTNHIHIIVIYQGS